MNENPTAAKIAATILDLLDNGVSPWHKPWSVAEPTSIYGKPYRGWNRFFLGILGDPDFPVYLTYRQAQKLGGFVRKGEHGVPVIAYKPEHEREILYSDGETEKENVPLFLSGYIVFSVNQCEGLDPSTYEKLMPRENDNNPIDEAEKIVQNFFSRIGSPKLTHGGSMCGYLPKRDAIRVPKISRFDSSDDYYSSLFHEMAHSTGAKSRLAREMSQERISYAKEELVAEICAAMLCAKCGIVRPLANAASYCKGWAETIREMPARAIPAAAAKAQKAYDYIMGVKQPSEADEAAE